MAQVTKIIRIARHRRDEQAESQTSNDDLCVGGESGDVLKASTPQVELQSKGGKDQGITSQKTDHTYALATYHKDLMDGIRVNAIGEQAQLVDLMYLSKQIHELIRTLEDCINNDSITTDDGTRLKENPNCEFCSVTKDRIKRISEKFQLFSDTWESAGREIRQKLKEMSIVTQKQKGELLQMEEALDSVQVSLARYW